jgi:hypothetical protein
MGYEHDSNHVNRETKTGVFFHRDIKVAFWPGFVWIAPALEI